MTICSERISSYLGRGLAGDRLRSSSHLSPGISLISDLAYDSGMLQSELFTCRSQNLVLAKLPSSGFWRYGHFYPISLEKLAISPKT